MWQSFPPLVEGQRTCRALPLQGQCLGNAEVEESGTVVAVALTKRRQLLPAVPPLLGNTVHQRNDLLEGERRGEALPHSVATGLPVELPARSDRAVDRGEVP